jgi:hypothetical protein
VNAIEGANLPMFGRERRDARAEAIWMPRGGKREGAGRKAGDGWKAPKPATLREASRQTVAKIFRDGGDPLSVVCEIALDAANEPTLRIEAAKAALPFLYPRLSAVVTASIDPNKAGGGGVTAAAMARRLNDKLAALLAPGVVLDGVAEKSSAPLAPEMADIGGSSAGDAFSPQFHTQTEAKNTP